MATVDKSTQYSLSKVPEVTLLFWVCIKIAATTLGETGGDAVTMSANLGYLVGTGIFAAIFIVAVAAQIRAKEPSIPLCIGSPSSPPPQLEPPWPTLPTVPSASATPEARRCSRHCWLLRLRAWYRTMGSISVDTVATAKGRNILLGNHHVFADAGNGARRLDRRYSPTSGIWAARPCFVILLAARLSPPFFGPKSPGRYCSGPRLS